MFEMENLIFKIMKTLAETEEDYNHLIIASKLIIDLIKSINNEVGKIDDLERLEWLEEHVTIKETVVITQ